MITDKLNDILNSNEDSTSYDITLYIKEHIQDIPHMTIEELAQACYVFKGQISKYTKKLGYAHFSLLKEDCKKYNESIARRARYYTDKYTLQENCSHYTQELVEAMQYSTAPINYKHLERLINKIEKASRIYIYCQGNTKVYGNLLQIELKMKNKDAYMFDGQYNVLKSDDLFLVLSVNGNSFFFDENLRRGILKNVSNPFLLTCKNDPSFEHLFVIPTNNDKYNEMVFEHVLHLILHAL